jgi:hypothetical protein
MRRRRQRPTPESPSPPSDVAITEAGQRRNAPRRTAPPDVDARIAALAGAQDGMVTRAQLLALPLSAGAIDGRVRAGRLHPRFRGIYAVGHAAVSPRGRLRAGLLATGDDAALSHATSAYAWQLSSTQPDAVHALVARCAPRSRPGLVVHETRRPFVPVLLAGLPFTPPLRTLADLAPLVAPEELARLCGEALVRRLVTQEDLDAAGLTDPELPPPPSVFARRFQLELERAGLPLPVIEHPVGRYRGDFAWLAERVIVETDGWNAHGHRKRFETDRARDGYLMARGWVVLRVTWRRLKHEPVRVMIELAQILALRATSEGAA